MLTGQICMVPHRSVAFPFFPSLNLLFPLVCKMCTATFRWLVVFSFFSVDTGLSHLWEKVLEKQVLNYY